MTKNRVVTASSGWLMLAINIAFWLLGIVVVVRGAGVPVMMIAGGLILLVAGFMTPGYFTVNPNYSALLVLFGKYKGTVKDNGFFWANPLLKKIKISLRVRNQETSRIKVNDLAGNPIEIAAVVVWNVTDPYRARFEVDAYTDYVSVQSKSALRHLPATITTTGKMAN